MKIKGILRSVMIFLLVAGGFTSLPAQKVKKAPPAASPVVEFSVRGGFFSDEVIVHLIAPAAQVYYTYDGSRPGIHSRPYRRPLRITGTAVIRAVAYRDGQRGPTVGHTFFIGEPPTDFPVVSIGIAPSVLFHREKGLFVQGADAVDSLESKPGANFWSRKEVLINTEIFESNGGCVYRSETGMRLFGGMSRLFPQKSLAIVARDRYGVDPIRHPLFGQGGPDEFKFLVLRNSGSDWGKSHFRDAMMTGLVRDWDLETQRSRPAHVYINGRYWGIYHIREKVNRYFINTYHDIDKDSIDLLEHYMTLKKGSRRHYYNMLDFMKTHDLSSSANYAYLRGLMEMGNFMDHQIAQIYFDNRDAGGNIKYWRAQRPGARWRWILYDTDWGFGLHDPEAYRFNSLAFHTEPDGPNWPNPPWSTFMLRKLLENETFERQFLNRFADRLNTSLRAERVERHINAHYQTLLPEMPRQLNRWNLRRERWENHVARMRIFARQRPSYVWRHLQERFAPGEFRQLQVATSPGGTVILNDNLEINPLDSFNGQYFSRIPVSLKAEPDYGFRFSHWEGIRMRKELRDIRLYLREPTYRVRAVFERYIHPLAGKVVINEIGPVRSESGDWVELYNHSDRPVFLRDWLLIDSKHEFRLPNVRIEPKDYLVICQDSARFRRVFPQAYNIISGLPFGINKHQETIGLYADRYAMIDSVSYRIPPTDSVFSLSLLLPTLDNSQLENWSFRFGLGTPNQPNPYYVESRIRYVQEKWMQVGLAAGVVLICILLLVLRHREVL